MMLVLLLLVHTCAAGAAASADATQSPTLSGSKLDQKLSQLLSDIHSLQKHLHRMEAPLEDTRATSSSFTFAFKATIVAEICIVLLIISCSCFGHIANRRDDDDIEVPCCLRPCVACSACCTTGCFRMLRHAHIRVWVLAYVVIANLVWMYMCTWRIVEQYVAQGIVISLIAFLILGAFAIMSMTLWQQHEDWAHSIHDRFAVMHEHIDGLADSLKSMKHIPASVGTGIAKGAKKGREQCIHGLEGIGSCAGTRKGGSLMLPSSMFDGGSPQRRLLRTTSDSPLARQSAAACPGLGV